MADDGAWPGAEDGLSFAGAVLPGGGACGSDEAGAGALVAGGRALSINRRTACSLVMRVSEVAAKECSRSHHQHTYDVLVVTDRASKPSDLKVSMSASGVRHTAKLKKLKIKKPDKKPIRPPPTLLNSRGNSARSRPESKA